MDLAGSQYWPDHDADQSYAWEPSDKAMNGRKDQSLSTAGSLPPSTPNQLSISGPLPFLSLVLMYCPERTLPRMMEGHNADKRRKGAHKCHVVGAVLPTFPFVLRTAHD